VIRPATADDAEVVARLWTEAYVTGEPGGRAEPYVASDYTDAARRGHVFVAEEGGEVVGAVVHYPAGTPGRATGGEDEAELSRLVVAASARRRGIGAALVELCGERAAAEGCEAIALWSRPWQMDAHRLYERHGYSRMPDRDKVDAGGGERRVFKHTLR
jgi:predicted N-acetyltransferase YhbS